MGLQPTEFENMTPAEFRYAFDGWLAEKEEKIIREWEQARFVAYYAMVLDMEPKHRKPMKVMFPMAWDSPEDTTEVPEISYEERVRRVREFRKMKEKSAKKRTDESH